MNKQVNVFEDPVGDLINRTIGLRFDICRCDLCRSAMKEMTLDNLPVFLINPTNFKYKELTRKIASVYFKRIMEEASKAITYIGKHPPHKMDEDHEAGFHQLIERIYQDRGLDFSHYRKSILKRRVALRLRANNLNSYREYLHVLADNPDEYKKLFDVLTINVSEFFRDMPVWGEIKKLLKKIIIEENDGSRARIWSAGCAKGEEPYSLAILTEEIGGSRGVDIYATDIDSGSLSEARRGIYDVGRIRNVPDDTLRKYFDFDGKGNYVLKEFVKNKVIFRRNDLINDAILPKINIIMCRNVFIYFTKPLQETILNKFYDSLVNGGYLIIGKTETILTEAKLIFESVDADNGIYRKKIV